MVHAKYCKINPVSPNRKQNLKIDVVYNQQIQGLTRVPDWHDQT